MSRPEFLLPFAFGALVLFVRRLSLVHPQKRNRLRTALAIAASAEVLLISYSLFPYPPRGAAERRPGVVGNLSESCGGRVALLTEPGVPESEYQLAPNRLLSHGIPCVTGFSTIPPWRMDQFLDMAQDRHKLEAYRLLGVEYLVSELVHVRGTAFDLSLGLRADSWVDGAVLSLPFPDPSRLCLLVVGDLFGRSVSGRWEIVLHPPPEGRSTRLF